MSLTPRAFAKRWWNTACKDFFSKARAVWFFVAILVGLVLWAVPRLEPYRTWLPFSGPLAFLLAYLAYRLGRAPWDMAKADHAAVVKANQDADELTDRLTDHQKHEELADALVEKCAWVTHQLLNKVPLNGMAPDDLWMLNAHMWREEVLQILKQYGCNKGEMNAFETMNGFDISLFSPPAHKEVGMVYVRLDRLGTIATEHRRRAEELKLAPGTKAKSDS